MRDAVESCDGLRIDLLGPVEARLDGSPVALGGRLPRALFAVLALSPRLVLPADALIDELWGDDPPARARESLQMHVSRLRRALAAAGAPGTRIVARAGGYVLDVADGTRDVDAWEAALAQGRRARAAGRLAAARAEIEQALRLWRGPPLAGVAANGLLGAERARLEQERLVAVVEGIELDLELGRHGEVLGQVEALVIAHPYAEHLIELQMLALHRSGRQADALEAFRTARDRFVEDLGIEPGQPLRDLHEAVLQQSPALLPARAARGGEGVPAGPAAAEPTASGRFTRRRLPTPPNRTIGRDAEIAAIGARLRQDSVRLLTVTGPGGVGKTRLAIEAARAVQAEFADGATFVPLAATRDAAGVPAAVVDALGIVPEAGESPEQTAERALIATDLLLVVDNFEHLLAGARFISGLLDACPALTVLATSREALALRAEERHAVAPLAQPETGREEDADALAGNDAVTLFCERARAQDPGFALDAASGAAVAHICRRVDGLPLAIELAAARCGLLSAREIADRLDEALAAPGAGARDAAARQQTLRATIDWSHALLDDTQQACFARLGVFDGGAPVDAAEAVTGADLWTLDALVAKNLVVRRRHADAPTRLHMLETIRAHAVERLAATRDPDAIRDRHYRWFLAFAQFHGAERALMGAARREHTARLDAESANLRAALLWAVGRPDARPALELSVALDQYWWTSARYAEAAAWFDRALGLPIADSDSALRVHALCGKALALWPTWRTDETAATAAEAEAVARALGDPVTLSLALQVRARIDGTDGPSAQMTVSAARAKDALDLATAAENQWAIAMAAYAQAITATTLADLRVYVERAVALLDEAGNVYHLVRVLAASIYNALCLGGDDVAKAYVERASAFADLADDPQSRSFLLGNAGMVAVLTGDADAADAALREELRLQLGPVAPRFAHDSLRGLAAVAAARRDDERCARLLGAVTAQFEHARPDEVDARLEAEFFVPARQRCRTWEEAERAGRALSLDDAVAYALDESQT